MIGTTHFTNAVVERRRLQPTACIRLGLPATVCLPPMVDWPDDLAEVVGHSHHLAHGGHEFDGREISPFDPDEIKQGLSGAVVFDGRNIFDPARMREAGFEYYGIGLQ